MWVLPVVRKVERILAADESITKEYGPPFGYTNFTDPATKLLLGENSPALLEDRVLTLNFTKKEEKRELKKYMLYYRPLESKHWVVRER